MKLPNFIIIGAGKCGTTSLHSYLNQHPDIFYAQKKKLFSFSMNPPEKRARNGEQ